MADRLSPNVVLQSVGDGAVLLASDSGQLFTCNKTAESFLSHLDGVREFDEIITLLLEEFEVDRATLSADLEELVGHLRQLGLICAN